MSLLDYTLAKRCGPDCYAPAPQLAIIGETAVEIVGGQEPLRGTQSGSVTIRYPNGTEAVVPPHALGMVWVHKASNAGRQLAH